MNHEWRLSKYIPILPWSFPLIGLFGAGGAAMTSPAPASRTAANPSRNTRADTLNTLCILSAFRIRHYGFARGS